MPISTSRFRSNRRSLPQEVAYALSLLAKDAVKAVHRDDEQKDLVTRANELRDQIDNATLELGETLRELAAS